MAVSTSAREIAAHLASKGLPATSAWVDDLASSQRANTPILAVKQTALFRILQSDITSTLQISSQSTLPTDIVNGEIRERSVACSVPVQVLDMEDIGRSRWSQADELEAIDRGEQTKGREIIRVVPGEADEAEPAQPASAGPYKLLLQDARGTCAYALELASVHGIDAGLNIGAKLVLKNFKVARGCILLEPGTCSVLGGKIENLHKRWKEGRKEALKTAARASASEAD